MSDPGYDQYLEDKAAEAEDEAAYLQSLSDQGEAEAEAAAAEEEGR